MSSTGSVIQHIQNEQHPYRVPLFKLKSNPVHFSDTIIKTARTMRLTTCDFVSNYYNIGYNNNCVRWLRIVKTNDGLNPYFLNYDNDIVDIHLCKLYITPGIYSSISDIIAEINNKMRYSIMELFGAEIKETTYYAGQSVVYETDDGRPKVSLYSPLGVAGVVMGDTNGDTTFGPGPTGNGGTYVINGSSSFVTEKGDTVSIATGFVQFNESINEVGGTLSKATINNISFKDNNFTCDLQCNILNGVLSNDNSSSNMLESGDISNVVAKFIVKTQTGDEYKCDKIVNAVISDYLSSKLNLYSVKFGEDTFEGTDAAGGSVVFMFDTVNDSGLSIKIDVKKCDDVVTAMPDGSGGYKHTLTPLVMQITVENIDRGIYFSGIRSFDQNNLIPAYDEASSEIHDVTRTRRQWPQTFEILTLESNNINSITIDLSATDSKGLTHNYGCRIKTRIVSGNVVPNMFEIDIFNVDQYGQKYIGDYTYNSEPDDYTRCLVFTDAQTSLPPEAHFAKGDTDQFDNATFQYKSRIVRYVNNAEGQTFKLAWYDMLSALINVNTGTLASGKLVKVPGFESVPSTLLEIDKSNPITVRTTDTSKNEDLKNDLYFNELLNGILNDNEYKFFTLLTGNNNDKVGFQSSFDMIPVTCDTIYSNSTNFLNIVQDPNFQTKYTTNVLPKVTNYNSPDNYSLTEDNYKLSYYVKQNELIDNYYYNFAIDGVDVWKKLGFNPCKFEHSRNTITEFQANANPDEADISTEFEPTYFIKGVYYSETNYHGPITLQHKSRITVSTGVGTRDTILPEGYNIKNFLTTGDTSTADIFNTFFYKKSHVADWLPNLSIPKTIEVKITQNKDVEEYLNSNEIVDSIANIGTYEVVRENEPMINAIQQQMNINQTIELPPNDELYVFLTNGNHIYSLMDTAATLNVEYIS